MKKDYLKQFVSLHESLLKEKAALEDRLCQINEALGTQTSKPAASAKASVKAPKAGKRARNSLSLKAAVLQATKDKPLAKTDILAAIKKLGYKFSTNDPMNSLNTVLYTGKQFKNTDGLFSPR